MATAKIRAKLHDVAARLTWARTASGLNRTALSVRAGLVKGHVALIEDRRRVNIDIETAQKIAAVLGVDWQWLRLGEGDPPTEAQIKKAVAGAA
jgi:transcriptional regulator with XRE-family HTH domain